MKRRKSDELLDRKGIYEVLLQNEEGFLTEGSRSNFFYIKDDQLYTSPVKTVLPGIARKNIIKSCSLHGISVIEKSLHINEIDQVDSMFLSGTSPKVLPIRNIQNTQFVMKNILLREVQAIYNQHIDDYITGFNFPTN